MSREIKFRAWSKDGGKFYYDAEETYEGLVGANHTSFGTLLEDNNYIVEQYTGLKDKNGKEIYEGDIVKILDAPAVSGKALVVKFDEFYIGEYNCNKMTGWMVQVINGEWAASLADEISRCEVIGNIHENSELLGEEE